MEGKKARVTSSGTSALARYAVGGLLTLAMVFSGAGGCTGQPRYIQLSNGEHVNVNAFGMKFLYVEEGDVLVFKTDGKIVKLTPEEYVTKEWLERFNEEMEEKRKDPNRERAPVILGRDHH